MAEFARLVALARRLETSPLRLDKVALVAEFLRALPPDDVATAVAALALHGGAEALAAHGGRPALEYKYDGARIQLHHDGDRISVWTRRSPT